MSLVSIKCATYKHLSVGVDPLFYGVDPYTTIFFSYTTNHASKYCTIQSYKTKFVVYEEKMLCTNHFILKKTFNDQIETK